jgi:hypothetical protein
MMECEDCGSDEGFEGYCPYDEDVNGITTKCILCSKCY